ncbi:MAG: aspartate aminotransferase family protein, partial [Stenotrophomonas sp.]
MPHTELPPSSLSQQAPAALDAWWMPFTANRQFKAAPRLVRGASGVFYRSLDGREILDGSAGLWCV